MTGVRAYERRPDLRANNRRLIQYAENGGTVLVQYNKFEFNDAQYGPYPAKVSADRVTDEHAPVEVLVPDHPVFNRPNKIGPDAWDDWVQERGLYFLGERDPRYVDLVRTQDPFPLNAVAQDRRAGGGARRQGPLDLYWSRTLAPAARRDGRRLPPDGQPSQPGTAVVALSPEYVRLRPQRELRRREGAVPRAVDGDQLRAPRDAGRTRHRRARGRARDS